MMMDMLAMDVLMNYDCFCEVSIGGRATLRAFFLLVLLVFLFLRCVVYRCWVNLRRPIALGRRLAWLLTVGSLTWLPAWRHGCRLLTTWRYINALRVHRVDWRRRFVIVHNDRLIGVEQTLLSDILNLLFSLFLRLFFIVFLRFIEHLVTAIGDASATAKTKDANYDSNTEASALSSFSSIAIAAVVTPVTTPASASGATSFERS